jgi:hypothetical protein
MCVHVYVHVCFTVVLAARAALRSVAVVVSGSGGDAKGSRGGPSVAIRGFKQAIAVSVVLPSYSCRTCQSKPSSRHVVVVVVVVTRVPRCDVQETTSGKDRRGTERRVTVSKPDGSQLGTFVVPRADTTPGVGGGGVSAAALGGMDASGLASLGPTAAPLIMHMQAQLMQMAMQNQMLMQQQQAQQRQLERAVVARGRGGFPVGRGRGGPRPVAPPMGAAADGGAGETFGLCHVVAQPRARACTHTLARSSDSPCARQLALLPHTLTRTLRGS